MVRMEKPMKYTIAVVLRDAANSERFLVVQRPSDDPDLKGAWGLPAVTMDAWELPEDAAKRVCLEKLGCRAVPVRFVGSMHQRRNNYDITLMDIEMLLLPGEQPDVHKATTSGTIYPKQKWATNARILLPSAKRGSCCSSILLTDKGLLSRGQWVDSLAGSALVG